MKRSEINKAISKATLFFEKNGWTIPPDPKWDVTDFGLGNFKKTGLVLINLAEELEYCEKLMYAGHRQITPAHSHKKKKEDLICRKGILFVQLWSRNPAIFSPGAPLKVKVNGRNRSIQSGDKVMLQSGERVRIMPGVWHEFYAGSEGCIIGEVSIADDDINDNSFCNINVERFSDIVEDEPACIKLVSDN